MARPYTIETNPGVQPIAPQQAEHYSTQLDAISALAVGGGMLDTGAGIGAARGFLQAGSGRSQVFTSLVWHNPVQPHSAAFAVVSPQFGRNYFGVTSESPTTPNGLLVAGVGVLRNEGAYGQLDLKFDGSTGPDKRIPLAMGALVDNLRLRPGRQSGEEADAATPVGLAPDIHRRLGNAILSFWDTVSLPPQLAAERSGTRSAFELASLVIACHLDELQAAQAGLTEDSLWNVEPFIDRRGVASGFIRIDSDSQNVTAMVRNNAAYPERIDYMQFPLESTTNDEVMVVHHQISRHAVATRVCILPLSLLAERNLRELLLAVQNDNRPMEDVDEPREVASIVRMLYAEMGPLLLAENNQE